LSLVLFKLPIHPRLSLGTFVGNVKDGIIRAIDKKVVTANAAPDVAAKLKELGIASK